MKEPIGWQTKVPKIFLITLLTEVIRIFDFAKSKIDIIKQLIIINIKMDIEIELQFLTRQESELVEDYQRYIVTTKQLRYLEDYVGDDKRMRYEAKNILERWKLSQYQNNNNQSLEKMKGELIEKNIANNEKDADLIVDNILGIEREDKFYNYDLYDFEFEDRSSSKIVKYGKYKRAIPTKRFVILMSLDNSLVALTRMLLRYASVLSGSQQWNIPKSVYEIMVKRYGIVYEGFASPMNSQIIQYNTPEKKYNFYSLFPDTDGIYGSLGSFFNSDLVGKVGTINPPYIISIMESTVNHCIKQLYDSLASGKGTRMFITVPNWTDANYFKQLQTTEFKEAEIFKKKGTYYYEDTNYGFPKKITASFNSTLFVLSVNMKTRYDYRDLKDAWSV
jgi:hypothetical protein